jgi:ParB/RepB/Spo0J family partition protein
MTEKKEFIKISELTNWADNPRDIDDDKFQELKNRIERHGQIKPVIVNSGKYTPTKGEVLGGNMRFRAFRELGIEDIWVSWVHPKTEAEKIEIALTDNEELGFYKIDEITTLIQKYKADIDLTKYAIHLDKPQTLEEILKIPNIDFGNVDDNSDREKNFKEMTVTCPHCQKSFDIKV